jgi:hypothetical protein
VFFSLDSNPNTPSDAGTYPGYSTLTGKKRIVILFCIIYYFFSLDSNLNAPSDVGMYPGYSTLTSKKKNLFFVCISYFLSL